jgi:hypothetical protein
MIKGKLNLSGSDSQTANRRYLHIGLGLHILFLALPKSVPLPGCCFVKIMGKFEGSSLI